MLAAMIGAALREHRCAPIRIGEQSGEEQRALYVAVNAAGFACYGGQTRPTRQSAGAAARRISQHINEPDKAGSWIEYWVFPLHTHVHPDDINRLERDLNARLGIPLRHRQGRRLARGSSPPAPST